jgi:hypothetical protein
VKARQYGETAGAVMPNCRESACRRIKAEERRIEADAPRMVQILPRLSAVKPLQLAVSDKLSTHGFELGDLSG